MSIYWLWAGLLPRLSSQAFLDFLTKISYYWEKLAFHLQGKQLLKKIVTSPLLYQPLISPE